MSKLTSFSLTWLTVVLLISPLKSETRNYLVWMSSFTTGQLNTAKNYGFKTSKDPMRNTQFTMYKSSMCGRLEITPKNDTQVNILDNLEFQGKIQLLGTSEIVSDGNGLTVRQTKMMDLPDECNKDWTFHEKSTPTK